MNKSKPNYLDPGLSSPMGPKLRALVEQQLLTDLFHYGVTINNPKFDWSESCVEGHDSEYLDGSLENYSGIAIYDGDDKLVVDGWMEFIHENNFFLVFWDFLYVYEGNKKIVDKNKPGIPDHVWKKIPTEMKGIYEKDRM